MGMSGMGRRVDRASSGNLQTNQQMRQTAQQGFIDSGYVQPQAGEPTFGEERPSFAKLGDKLGDQLKQYQRG